MFIRLKTIQKKHYAYLVKNIWSKRKQISKQKVVRYLGPVIKLERQKDLLLDELYKIEDLSHHIELFPSISIFKKMLTLELINHGFKKRGRNLFKDDISVNLSKKAITRNGKSIVLELNEGFISSYTLTKLYNFQIKTFDTKKEGLNFANVILQTGITLDQEVFVALFNKIYKKG